MFSLRLSNVTLFWSRYFVGWFLCHHESLRRLLSLFFRFVQNAKPKACLLTCIFFFLFMERGGCICTIFKFVGNKNRRIEIAHLMTLPNLMSGHHPWTCNACYLPWLRSVSGAMFLFFLVPHLKGRWTEYILFPKTNHLSPFCNDLSGTATHLPPLYFPSFLSPPTT